MRRSTGEAGPPVKGRKEESWECDMIEGSQGIRGNYEGKVFPASSLHPSCCHFGVPPYHADFFPLGPSLCPTVLRYPLAKGDG